MKYAILYNVFCCFMVTLIGAATARHILLYRDRGPVDRSFAFFWAFAGGLWFFGGLRLIFHYLYLPYLDRLVFYVVQFFVVLHMAAGVSHTVGKLTANRRIVGLVDLLMTPAYGLFLFFMLHDGVTLAESTVWGTEYAISKHAFWAFLTPFAVCLLGNAYDVLRRTAGLAMGRRTSLELFCASSALTLYCAAGIADTKGVTADWRLLAIRATYLVAALVAYTGYTWESDPVFLRDTVERSDL